MTQYRGVGPSGSSNITPTAPYNNYGVWGDSKDAVGTFGTSAGSFGVWAASSASGSSGVLGSGDFSGVAGVNNNGYGLAGYSSRGTAVEGTTDGDMDGIHGQSQLGNGVHGESDYGYGVLGRSDNGDAVAGIKTGGNGAAGSFTNLQIKYLGRGRFSHLLGTAGNFWGHVDIKGNLWVTGTKGFRIDHPLEPANKVLSHSSVESSDMKNLYDGVADLDERGEATVELPRWFEALNRDYRYQLTPIGEAAPHLHVVAGVRKNRFRIAGGTPGIKVSWQVSGIRQDAWAREHPMRVEESKGKDRGRYLNPEMRQAKEGDLEKTLYLELSQQLRHVRTLKARRDPRPLLKKMMMGIKGFRRKSVRTRV